MNLLSNFLLQECSSEFVFSFTSIWPPLVQSEDKSLETDGIPVSYIQQCILF